MRILSALFAFLFALSVGVDGFVTKPTSSLGSIRSAQSTADTPLGAYPTSSLPTRRSFDSSTVLYSKIDGSREGNYLLVLALAICVWMFSIPTEFRRAHFCASNECVERRAACNDCITLSEWSTGVADYYKNGGGVEFDFSIDPATKKTWEQAVGIYK